MIFSRGGASEHEHKVCYALSVTSSAPAPGALSTPLRQRLDVVIIPALQYPDFAIRDCVRHFGESRAPEGPQQDSRMWVVVVIRQHCPGLYADRASGKQPQQQHRLTHPPNAGSADRSNHQGADTGSSTPERFQKSDTGDRKSTRLNSSHTPVSRMPSSA